MTKAAFELQTSDTKVMDIGLKYGYDSPTSFNRAFQNVHGVAPTLARIEGTILNNYPRISFSTSVMGDDRMKYRIETKGPIRVIGVKTALQEDIEKNFKIVPQFWNTTIEGNYFTQICKLNVLRILIFEETFIFNNFLPVIFLFSIMCCASFSLAVWRLKKETAY